mmetsp:Transcript_10133/g.24593  ORF Transcript_10133/g.24593 Transcript_10133/m.24593 type:complete len:86 (-) Transcript_10133:40-297(-)
MFHCRKRSSTTPYTTVRACVRPRRSGESKRDVRDAMDAPFFSTRAQQLEASMHGARGFRRCNYSVKSARPDRLDGDDSLSTVSAT